MTCYNLAKHHFYWDLSLTLFLLYIPITIYYVRNYEKYFTFIPTLIERIDIQRSIESTFLLCNNRRSISLDFNLKSDSNTHTKTKKKTLTSNIPTSLISN